MLAFTIGNVKSGDVSIAPFKKAYPSTSSALSSIKVKDKTKAQLDDLKNATVADGTTAKYSIVVDGVDDNKVQSIADSMRKLLVQDSDDGNSQAGTQVTLPFNLKLGITLDGIENIGFMEPVTIDRLPNKYQQVDGLRFLVEGIEHTFDGNGGWETKISTAMKIGKVGS